MADQPVTREKLINADKDVQVIEDFIKKPKNETVTTRFGDEIMTLKGLEEGVKKSGGYFKRYTTLAAANADIANIPVNSVVKVTDAVNGGDYEKAAAGAATLTKSAYDPLTQAKGYTDTKLPITGKLYNPAKNAADLYINASSPYSVASAAGTMLTIFPVEPGKTYSIKTNAVLFPAFVVALRATETTIAGTTLGIAALSATQDPFVKRFTVPAGSNAKFALVNLKIPSIGLDASSDLLVNEGLIVVNQNHVLTISGAEIADQEARRKMISDEKLITTLDLYSPISNIDGKYVDANNSNVTAAVGTMLTIFPIRPGYSYALKSSGIQNGAALVALRENNATTVGSTLGITPLLSTTDPQVKVFNVASNSTARYAFLNIKVPSVSLDLTQDLHINAGGFHAASRLVIGIEEKQIADPDAQQRISVLEANIKPSKLYGKTWVAIGDSITEKNFRANKNYHDFVKEQVGGMTVHNYGISGSGFWNRANTIAGSISQKPDYITVFWGANDLVRAPKTLGNRDSTGTDSLGGLMNIAISSLLTKFYDKKFAIFTLLPRSNYNNVTNATAVDEAGVSQGYTATQVADLTIEICEKYSVPVLDLYRISNLYPWVADANQKYFTAPTLTTPDGLHPNDAGQELISYKIRDFLESL